MNYETEIKSDLGDASDVKFAEQGGFKIFLKNVFQTLWIQMDIQIHGENKP